MCMRVIIKKCECVLIRDYKVERERDRASQCSPQAKIQGMTGGHSLGGARGHIKANGLSLFPLCTEGLLGADMPLLC